MTLTPSRIACWTAATESELKQPLHEADAVLDHVRARGDAADRAALDAVERRRGDAVAGGGRRGVRAVTLGVARASTRAVVSLQNSWPSELVVRHVRLRHGVGADQLVVAGERRAEVGDVRAVAEVAVADRQQAAGGAGRPRWRSIGCSGQTPVSMTPTTTLLPALAEPPSVGQTLVAPMNAVLSSSGWLSVSFWTATHARGREQRGDLVRRHPGRDAAVGDRVSLGRSSRRARSA